MMIMTCSHDVCRIAAPRPPACCRTVPRGLLSQPSLESRHRDAPRLPRPHTHTPAPGLPPCRTVPQGLLSQSSLDFEQRCRQAAERAQAAEAHGAEAQAAAKEEARRRQAADKKLVRGSWVAGRLVGCWLVEQLSG